MGMERGLAREDCSQGLTRLGLSPSSGAPLGRAPSWFSCSVAGSGDWSFPGPECPPLRSEDRRPQPLVGCWAVWGPGQKAFEGPPRLLGSEGCCSADGWGPVSLRKSLCGPDKA